MRERAQTWRIEPVLRLPYNVGKLLATSETDLVVSDPIDVSAALDGWLLVNVHANSLGTNEFVEVSVDGIAPSCDEPETTFLADPNLAFTRVRRTHSAGTLRTARLSWRLPSHVRIALRLVQDSSSPTSGVRPVSLTVALLLQGWGMPAGWKEGCACGSAR